MANPEALPASEAEPLPRVVLGDIEQVLAIGRWVSDRNALVAREDVAADMAGAANQSQELELNSLVRTDLADGGRAYLRDHVFEGLAARNVLDAIYKVAQKSPDLGDGVFDGDDKLAFSMLRTATQQQDGRIKFSPELKNSRAASHTKRESKSSPAEQQSLESDPIPLVLRREEVKDGKKGEVFVELDTFEEAVVASALVQEAIDAGNTPVIGEAKKEILENYLAALVNRIDDESRRDVISDPDMVKVVRHALERGAERAYLDGEGAYDRTAARMLGRTAAQQKVTLIKKIPTQEHPVATSSESEDDAEQKSVVLAA